MGAYLPVVIWLVGAIFCLYLARARNIKPGWLLRILAVVPGPLAIPLVLLLKQGKTKPDR